MRVRGDGTRSGSCQMAAFSIIRCGSTTMKIVRLAIVNALLSNFRNAVQRQFRKGTGCGLHSGTK
jgi:hypothetical protein